MMCSTLSDMKCKEIVNIRDGACLGCVNDLEIDTDCAAICALIVYGRPKCFGLLGHEENIRIPWKCIKIIGQDTILVECDFCCPRKKLKKNSFLDFLERL